MIVNNHLDEAANRTKEKIQWLLHPEQNLPTLNTHYHANYKDKFITYYKAAWEDSDLLRKLKSGLLAGESLNKALSSLNELGMSAKPTDLPKLLPPDPKENIMASVRAYFQGKRVTHDGRCG